jgi:Dual OB-containing domain
MKIVINHLTRMEKGYICVAGICPSTRAHVRPVTPGKRLTSDIAHKAGGPFRIGSVVELGPTKICGVPPLIEDVEFNPANAHSIGQLKHEDFWQLLTETAGDRLRSIFGEQLENVRTNLAILPGNGTASLGCLLPARIPRLYVSVYGKVRLLLEDADGTYDLSVTDLRLHRAQDYTPDIDRIQQVQTRLVTRAPVVIALGLTKALLKPGDSQARHWLQVNNIHFAES